MNWTGGRLQTSRNAGSNITAIQKKHFAKVRARVQRTPNTLSTFQFSFSKTPVEEDNPFRDEWLSLSGHGRDRKIDRECDDLDAFPPADLQLTPNKLRLRSRQLVDRMNIRAGGRNSQIERSRSRRSPSLIELSSRTSSESVDRPTKHGREYGQASGTENPSPPNDGDLEAQRRKLLQQRDWVGLEITNRARTKSPDMKDRDRIGKRRKLKETDHKLNKRYIVRRIKPNIAELDDLNWPKRSGHHHLDENDISIRIGSSLHSTQPTCREASIKPKRSHSSLQSEEMLLDHEMEFRSHTRDQPQQDVVSHQQRPVQPLPHNACCKWVAGGSALDDRSRPLGKRYSPESRRHSKHETNTKLGSPTKPTQSDPPLAVYNGLGRLIFSPSPCQQAHVSHCASNDQADVNSTHTICSVSVNASVPTAGPLEDSDNVRWKEYLAIPVSSALTNTTAANSSSMAALGGNVRLKGVVERDKQPVLLDQVTTNPQTSPDIPLPADSSIQSPDGRGISTGSSENSQPNVQSIDIPERQELKPVKQFNIAQIDVLRKDMQEISRIGLADKSLPDESSMWYSFVFGDGVLDDNGGSLEDDRRARNMHQSSSPLLAHTPEVASGSMSETNDKTLDALSRIANASDRRSLSPLVRHPGMDTLSIAANASDHTLTTPTNHSLKRPSSTSPSSLPLRRNDNIAFSPDEPARSMNSSILDTSDDATGSQKDPPKRSKVVFTKPSPFRGPRYGNPPPTICLGKSFGSSVIRSDKDIAGKKTKGKEAKIAEAMGAVEEIEDD